MVISQWRNKPTQKRQGNPLWNANATKVRDVIQHIEDFIWPRGDTEFLFQGWKRSERSEYPLPYPPPPSPSLNFFCTCDLSKWTCALSECYRDFFFLLFLPASISKAILRARINYHMYPKCFNKLKSWTWNFAPSTRSGRLEQAIHSSA